MPPRAVEPDHSIFRAYDIRGQVDQNLTSDIVHDIGRAFADVVKQRSGTNTVVIGGDGRLSTPELKNALAQGLIEGGSDVTDIGIAPTPLVYFAGLDLNLTAGIVVTGSHNPAGDNGLKLFFGRDPYAGGELQDLYHRVCAGQFHEGVGHVKHLPVIESYLNQISNDVALTGDFKVALDTGNGVAGPYARRVFESLGCEVVGIHEEVDGSFPNHHPDPSRPENLRDLIECVAQNQADIGLAFDGDADRVGVVTNRGEIISADRLIALFATSILRKGHRGPVIFDVKCGHALAKAIQRQGGEAVMCATGHTNLKALLKERMAPLAGEFSGHICFADRWFGFDDAFYAGARLLEIVDESGVSVADLFNEIPTLPSTPELFVETDDSSKFEIIDRLKESSGFDGGRRTLLDGLRVDFDYGWGLARASNTSPKLSLRFEAIDDDSLARIRGLFESELHNIDPKLKIVSH